MKILNIGSMLRLTFTAFLLMGGMFVNAAGGDDPEFLMEKLTHILKTKKGDDERGAPLENLLQEAEKALNQNTGDPEYWYTVARVRYWYADTQGITNAIRNLKRVRDELQEGIELDANDGDDFARSYLGLIYAASPPWPIGFRDRKKAEKLMLEAIEGEGNSPSNYFYYGYYLVGMDRIEEAQVSLLNARRLLLELPQPLNPVQDYLLESVDSMLDKVREEQGEKG